MKEIPPERKRRMIQAAVIGGIIGAALSGVIWFVTESPFFAIAIIPLAALLGAAQFYFMP